MSTHYHYIITGAGCAGSSLLLHMMRNPFFRNRKILVVDRSPRNTNDHTWCYWEKEPSLFEPIVYHRWEQLDFFADDFRTSLSITPYQYKMIRAADLYAFVQEEAATHDNIEWKYGTVVSIHTQNDKAVVQLGEERFTAEFVFNSILFENLSTAEDHPSLLQHFKGWVIKTPQPVFDPARASFMDFRVSQQEGTTFAYVLPTSPCTALVEYTLFTQHLLPQEQYNQCLRAYISSFLNIDDYTIEHEEFGVIPMTARKFPLQEGRVVHMGIAGGQVKASSGYAFRFIQKRAKRIVDGLVKGDRNFSRTRFADRRFRYYDKVLLTVLAENRMSGAAVFSAIFRHNPPERILPFLDNESSLPADLRIMQSVPTAVFLPAAWAALW